MRLVIIDHLSVSSNEILDVLSIFNSGWERGVECTQQLHGRSMFAFKAKIYGMLYNQSICIAFDETSSYWSALKSSQFFGFSLVTAQ